MDQKKSFFLDSINPKSIILVALQLSVVVISATNLNFKATETDPRVLP